VETFVPGDEFVVHETQNWRVNHRVDSTLPGYLIVAAKNANALDFSDLSPVALSELGTVFGIVTGALKTFLRPEHIHICRFGHDSDYKVHFHMIPIYRWVKEAYRRMVDQGGREVHYPNFIDGPSITLFVSEEFRCGQTPSEIPQPSVKEVIGILRAALTEATQHEVGVDRRRRVGRAEESFGQMECS
jgi:diadenosine tetraphosphate (Ap4A) HIT family hydrolase